MSAKPRYGTEALSGADRLRLHRRRTAERNRVTAELIVALLAEVPADVRQTYETDPVFGPIITKAREATATTSIPMGGEK
jgi:hypothetical protein